MKLRATFNQAPATPSTESKRPTPARPRAAAQLEASPAARNLAVAYHIARLIDRGVIADYTQAAQMLGVSQVRVPHMLSLLLLAPEIQEGILLGRLSPGDKELRRWARMPAWDEQLAAADQPRHGCRSA